MLSTKHQFWFNDETLDGKKKKKKIEDENEILTKLIFFLTNAKLELANEFDSTHAVIPSSVTQVLKTVKKKTKTSILITWITKQLTRRTSWEVSIHVGI